MKMQINNSFISLLFVTVLVLTASLTVADDLNPPPYRGNPLSVHAHWNLVLGSTTLNLTNWNSVDDGDPSTYLYPNFAPDPTVTPSGGGYDFQIPNWVDNMPVKYMRVQMTWVGSNQSPIVFSQGLDGVTNIVATTTFTSTPIILTSSVYQYFDLEFHPNLDFERIHVTLPGNNYLTQTVVDTVSTVPEPTTIALLMLGGLAIHRKRKASIR